MNERQNDPASQDRVLKAPLIPSSVPVPPPSLFDGYQSSLIWVGDSVLFTSSTPYPLLLMIRPVEADPKELLLLLPAANEGSCKIVEATGRLTAKISAQTASGRGLQRLIHHLVLLPSSSSVTASSPLHSLPCPLLPASQPGPEGEDVFRNRWLPPLPSALPVN